MQGVRKNSCRRWGQFCILLSLDSSPTSAVLITQFCVSLPRTLPDFLLIFLTSPWGFIPVSFANLSSQPLTVSMPLGVALAPLPHLPFNSLVMDSFQDFSSPPPSNPTAQHFPVFLSGPALPLNSGLQHPPSWHLQGEF